MFVEETNNKQTPSNEPFDFAGNKTHLNHVLVFILSLLKSLSSSLNLQQT